MKKGPEIIVEKCATKFCQIDNSCLVRGGDCKVLRPRVLGEKVYNTTLDNECEI